MRLHMGITPFVCRICGKKYTRKDQLEYHIRKHTGNKPFHCHVCGKSFPFQAILNQHFKKNHPGCTLLEGLHSISPETTSKGQNGEQSPPQDQAKAVGELIHTSISTTGPDWLHWKQMSVRETAEALLFLEWTIAFGFRTIYCIWRVFFLQGRKIKLPSCRVVEIQTTPILLISWLFPALWKSQARDSWVYKDKKGQWGGSSLNIRRPNS